MSKATRRREMARAREAARAALPGGTSDCTLRHGSWLPKAEAVERAALADDGRSRAVAALVLADGTETAL